MLLRSKELKVGKYYKYIGPHTRSVWCSLALKKEDKICNLGKNTIFLVTGKQEDVFCIILETGQVGFLFLPDIEYHEKKWEFVCEEVF